MTTPADFSKLLQSLQQQIHMAVEQSLQEAAAVVVDEAQKNVIGHQQEGWPAPSPATMEHPDWKGPLLRTGELRDSIKAEVRGEVLSVGSDNPEAAVQEHGDSHTPPRPFIQTAINHTLPEIGSILERRIKAAFEGNR